MIVESMKNIVVCGGAEFYYLEGEEFGNDGFFSFLLVPLFLAVLIDELPSKIRSIIAFDYSLLFMGKCALLNIVFIFYNLTFAH